MSESAFRRMQDLPSTHLLGAGTALCAGCGGLQALHTIYDVLGEKTVIVNAAGCMTLLSIYPFTPFRGSWLYTAMASAPAGAQGVRDALDLLVANGVTRVRDMGGLRGRLHDPAGPGTGNHAGGLVAHGLDGGGAQRRAAGHDDRVAGPDLGLPG